MIGINNRYPKVGLSRQLLLTFFAMLICISGFAQKTSTGSGPWNVAGTWTPAGVPGNNDIVTVNAGHTITVPVNATCRHLHISGTVEMTGTGIQLQITNQSAAGSTNGLRLNAGGILNIGATNELYFSNGQASGIVNNGGTIVSTGVNGADGGTIRANTCCGGQFGVSGSAATTVNNLIFDNNANFSLSSTLTVNGIFHVPNNNWSENGSSQSPIWGPASTLRINRNNQGITSCCGSPLNNNLDRLWNTSTGTIGVTPGYPNNVTVLNMGTSSGGVNVPPNVNVGWRPNVAIGLNGTFQVGDATQGGTNTGFVSLDQVPSFTSGGILVDNGSVLISPPAGISYVNSGDFIIQNGTYYDYGATIDFANAGTIGSPAIISTTGANVTFGGMTSSSGYVQLQDPVIVTTELNLTGGIIGTSTANSLSVTNSAITAITGGSSTSFVDGPLSWSFPSTTSGGYTFPIGDNGNYYPLTITDGNSNGTIVTAEAFDQNSNGIPDTTISAISPDEYWSVTTSSPFTGSPLVSVCRPTAVAPYNALGKSTTTADGIYTAIGGTPSGNCVNGGGLGSSSPTYVTIVNAFLNAVRVGGSPAGVDGSCNPTDGTLIVGGVGGTPPYEFSVNGSPFSTATTYGPLPQGPYTVTVRDNTGTTSTTTLHVLGLVQINGDDRDIMVCPGDNFTLTANNLGNSSPTYLWSPGGQTTPSITLPAPGSPTTYSVQSTIYANNVISNGSFEGGNPTGFTPSYDLYVGAPYGTTPDDGGYYTVNDVGTDQCNFFTNLPAQFGTNYFIGDANSFASDVFSLDFGASLNGGTVYSFSYWYAKGSNDFNGALETRHNTVGVLGSVAVTDHTAWNQVTYSFTANGTNDILTLRNTVAIGSTNGNDFYIDNLELLAPCVVSTSVEVTPECPLPVEYLFFEAERQGEGALLTWATASEQNSSHFVIERSTDGINFFPIGTVDAAGNSTAVLNYSFVDAFIPNGITYYRLAQYDVDGTLNYSDIRAVSKNGSGGIQISPNPNHGSFVITFDHAGGVKSQVSVVNALGQVVYVAKQSTDNFMKIDISHLPSAVYYLQVTTDEGTIVEKVMKE